MLTRVTDATTEPVELSDVKDSLILSGAEDDALITRYIKKARQRVEDFAHISLLAQTWELSLPISALNSTTLIQLPRPPITAVNSIKYVDDVGEEHEFDAGGYFLNKPLECVQLKSGYEWEVDEVVYYIVNYDTGYESVSAVPDGFKEAIVLVAHALYEERPEAELIPIIKRHIPERRRLF